ncbi:Sister chromatid cohesion 1 protein 4 [Diplonema papillatum]|nr:Sister chromatid cohesion 1 protein 4 [Diplonema papillatum]
MFFSPWIILKKGPLAKVWLAAHWEKKLTKNEVQLVDLNETVVQILQPPVPISCRTHGELLLGCVRIYANKVALLLKESSEATLLLTKKQTLRAAPVELIEEAVLQKEKAVTIPVGIEDLVEIPELASFDVADVLGTHANAEMFIPDDWFQQNAEFTQEAQLPPGVLPGDFFSPTSTRKSEASEIQAARDAAKQDDLLMVAPLDDNEFVAQYLPGNEITPNIDEPQYPSTTKATTKTDDTTDAAVLPPPPPPVRHIKVFDSETQLDSKVIKDALKSSYKLCRQFTQFPGTAEELRCKQDQRFSPTDLIVMSHPVRKRKLDIAFGESTDRLGLNDAPEDTKAARTTLFAEIVGRSLAKIGEDTGRDTSSRGGNLYGQATPGTTVTDFMPEQPAPWLQDVPPMMEEEPLHVVEPIEVVDPTVSAKETMKQLKTIMKTAAKASFKDLAPTGAPRRLAASKFMDLLVLSSKGHIELQQAKPYTVITLTKGDAFNSAVFTESESASPPSKRSRSAA